MRVRSSRQEFGVDKHSFIYKGPFDYSAAQVATLTRPRTQAQAAGTGTGTAARQQAEAGRESGSGGGGGGTAAAFTHDAMLSKFTTLGVCCCLLLQAVWLQW